MEVLRILLRIGPTETAHFQTWIDKAGNAPPLTETKGAAMGAVKALTNEADRAKIDN